MAPCRMARRRDPAHKVLAQHIAGEHQLCGPRRRHETPMAHRKRLPGPQAGGRIGSRRGSRMARLPPPRYSVHRRLRLPDLRTGNPSPLRMARSQEAPASCPSPPWTTQPCHRSVQSGTSRTPSRPCAGGSPSPSQRPSTAVHAASRNATEPKRLDVCDAVRLVV